MVKEIKNVHFSEHVGFIWLLLLQNSKLKNSTHHSPIVSQLLLSHWEVCLLV